jgi:hypothetical protein
MAPDARLAADPVAFGFVPAHWQTIRTFAAARGYVLAFRAGKKAAVPWIEHGFPAKPLTLKCKVDPRVGLLMAVRPTDHEDAERAGYPVLVAAGVDGFVAKLGTREAFGGQRFTRVSAPWAQADVVMDPTTRRPITSDYDLAAIVDTRHPDYYLTYGSLAAAANRTNPVTAAIAAELNRLFGSTRIVHGSEAQYSGSLAHGDDDGVLVFHPQGDVELVSGLPAWRTDGVLHGIVLRYFPDKVVWFQQ